MNKNDGNEFVSSDFQRRKEIVHVNSYKLYLYNVELNYLLEQANQSEIIAYNSNYFLRFCVDSFNINFCILACVLLEPRGAHSIYKLCRDMFPDKKKMGLIIEDLQTKEFRAAEQRVKTLRNACYAHNDAEFESIIKSIDLKQEERNILINGIKNTVRKIYLEEGADVASFDEPGEPGIRTQLRLMAELNVLRIAEVNRQMNQGKNIG